MRIILVICLIFGAFGHANADPIRFEGVTNDIRNVSPSNPYTEAGFTLTPENSRSAVYHAPAGSTLLGSSSDFFGFGEGNVITLTSVSGSFSLQSLLLGPLSITGRQPTTVTLVGNQVGGTVLNATFANVGTATLVPLNWSHLLSVQFETTLSAGLDDLAVDPVPEPATISLLAIGAAGLAVRRRRELSRSERR